VNRVGVGYDAHPLVPGRKLVLGGVEVAHDRGLLGHSDADVLVHAVVDALLGAAGLGELGELFPAGDPGTAGVSSLVFLERTAALLAERGWTVVNVDAVLVADRPRLSPFLPRMRDNLARVLGVAPERVSVKPKSNEGLGFAGRGEGMSACAVALLASSHGEAGAGAPHEGPEP
jgi:2-C-methyl-D-erythritol 2,4-cyclodiphosphate synthase